MKRFLTTFFVLMTSSTGFTQAPAEGLIAHWPFNGNALDESGNGHNGMVYGATLATDRFGFHNRAYFFDGVDDFIDCGADTMLGMSTAFIRTISFWIKSVDSIFPCISKFDYQAPGNCNYLLHAAPHGMFRIKGNGSNSSDIIMAHGQWMHLAVQMQSGTNGTKVYIDGILRKTTTITYALSLSPLPLCFGQVNGDDSIIFYKGYLDDIRIYDRILSAAEITRLYNQSPCVSQNTNALWGTIRYDNALQTPLRAVKVVMLSSSNTRLDSVMTSELGVFSFCSIPDGIFHLSVQPNHPWGGVNSTDALITLKHFVGLQPLDSLPHVAADVDNSGLINTLDAFRIQKRYTQQNMTFPAGNWVFENKNVLVSNGLTVISCLKGLCYGDVNRSYIPENNQFLACGDTLADTRDGQKYPSVPVGNQCWLAKNMNIGYRISGTQMMVNNSLIEKYCFNNEEANCNVYGGLYQWDEAMQYVFVAGTQGICPPGWHVPTDSEWCSLTLGLDNTIWCDSTGWSGLVAGIRMKEPGTAHWGYCNAGTNESGFTALGAGYLSLSQTFLYLKSFSYFWTSNAKDPDNSWQRGLMCGSGAVDRNWSGKNSGFSIRCLRN